MKKKAGVIQRFESSWLNADTNQKNVPAFSYSWNANEKQKTYVQFFGRKGFRVGNVTQVIQMVYCSDYFYIYLLIPDLKGIFYIDYIHGGGGYVVPDSNGSIYLDHWDSLGFDFIEPSKTFSYMLPNQVEKFNAVVKKFIQSCELTYKNILLSKMKVDVVNN